MVQWLNGSHQCRPGSNTGSGVLRGLRLFSAIMPAPRALFLRVSSLHKNQDF